MSTISAIPLAEETDTLIQKKPQASLKFQAHMGAANASTKAKKIVGAVAAAALILGGVLHLRARTGAIPERLPGGLPLLRVLRRRQSGALGSSPPFSPLPPFHTIKSPIKSMCFSPRTRAAPRLPRS